MSAAVVEANEVGAKAPGFQVHLPVFEGPFDLLLGLIAKHKLDITEVALATVTDDFIAYINGNGSDWDLDVASEFLVIAATLLDLKAARLLPAGEVEDAEDLALLEARDLLFARLLQYRAYKQVAALFAERIGAEDRYRARAVALEEPFAQLLPEVLIGLGPEQFAALAVRAMKPRPAPPGVSVAHLHAPAVSVREQVALLVRRLRQAGSTTFRALIADSPDTLTVVARFLGLLELYREAEVMFEQVTPFGELHIRWTGSADGEIPVSDEFDAGESTVEDNSGTEYSEAS
ncbi:MAG TPA: segregation/condensation protein A [Sporichthyaceae bacterium]|jgi:segregation and condensation protein A|nr:segregation/condensation protein A [Sporichthyaceae bacterium]